MDINELAVPVPTSAIEKHYHQTLSFQAERARHAVQRARNYGRLAAGLGAICFMEAAALYMALPLKQIVPVFIDVHKDGVVDTSASMSALPRSTQQAAIEAELWEYVRHREHYNFAEAPYDYQVVSGMSAPAVRAQYQSAVNPKNPNAPVNTLGKKTIISVRRISGAYLEHAPDYSSGRYQIRFAARVTEEGHPDTCQRMSVLFAYRPVASVPVTQRVTFNPAGIVITSYPRPEPEAPRTTDLAECRQ
ncbi:MAG TPA: VirB8/TrbF family protein [Acetobacteraceae bacterium]|nr:VirB8/TrbF family protein [Acetobacteraceae bacterium]